MGCAIYFGFLWACEVILAAILGFDQNYKKWQKLKSFDARNVEYGIIKLFCAFFT